jgi:septum formation protein
MSSVEETRVRFRKLDEEEITGYVNSGSPMDKAGAYGIQDDYGAVFVEKIQGCFYNVVGFPLTKFYIAFKKFSAELEKGT